MKRIYENLSSILLISTILLTFSACGGGGENGHSDDNNVSSSVLVQDCNISSDITAYTTMKSGDILRQKAANTVVKIYHSIDDKRVCTLSGQAYVVRN